MRSPRPVLGALLGLLMMAGCSGAAASPSSDPSSGSSRNVQLSTTFSTTLGVAITYDQSLVKAGARVAVNSVSTGHTTTVELAMRGLLPGHLYGANVHAETCGATADANGSRFQNVADPVQPSVDPHYANPENEIWLDLTTDATGAGSSRAAVPWAFTADRRAHSVVVHALPTTAGTAGTAATAVACISVNF